MKKILLFTIISVCLFLSLYGCEKKTVADKNISTIAAIDQISKLEKLGSVNTIEPDRSAPLTENILSPETPSLPTVPPVENENPPATEIIQQLPRDTKN